MPFWDPIILISQIVALQSLHYLTLAIFIPPAVSILSSRKPLIFSGGPANVNLIISWHELAGRSPVSHELAIDGIYSGGARLATSPALSTLDISDSGRRWIIATMWLLAALADVYYLYSFIRKPRLILDFTLTLFLNHIIITTYYSAAFPTSLFFWFIMTICATITLLLAEQLCVRRELSQDFKPVTPTAHEDPEEDADEQDVELTAMAR